VDTDHQTYKGKNFLCAIEYYRHMFMVFFHFFSLCFVFFFNSKRWHFYEESKVCVTGIVLKCQVKGQLLWLRK